MTTSTRIAAKKNARYAKNVLRRGNVQSTSKKTEKLGVSTYVIAFFVFVVVGSSIFQIISNAQRRIVES